MLGFFCFLGNHSLARRLVPVSPVSLKPCGLTFPTYLTSGQAVTSRVTLGTRTPAAIRARYEVLRQQATLISTKNLGTNRFAWTRYRQTE